MGHEFPQSRKQLIFKEIQQIQQRAGETSEALHERIREVVVNSFEEIKVPTEIKTPSWYTCDISGIVGVENSVAVSTSTCKHELPMRIFVGIRNSNWMVEKNGGYKYSLLPFGRELSYEEKSQIYDKM